MLCTANHRRNKTKQYVSSVFPWSTPQNPPKKLLRPSVPFFLSIQIKERKKTQTNFNKYNNNNKISLLVILAVGVLYLNYALWHHAKTLYIRPSWVFHQIFWSNHPLKSRLMEPNSSPENLIRRLVGY